MQRKEICKIQNFGLFWIFRDNFLLGKRSVKSLENVTVFDGKGLHVSCFLLFITMFNSSHVKLEIWCNVFPQNITRKIIIFLKYNHKFCIPVASDSCPNHVQQQ